MLEKLSSGADGKSGSPAPAPGSGSASLAVLIVGMHRSGTSAISGVLNMLGVAVPEDQHPADEHNLKGYFEPERIIDFHEALFGKLGTPSNDPLPLKDDWMQSSLATAAAEQLADLIDEEFAGQPLCLFKDPRICRVVPLWVRALDLRGREAVAVIPLRHPLEVAGSLQAKAGLSRPYALMMWLQHVVYGERATRGLKRSFTLYDDLMEDWRTVVAKLERELAVVWPRDIMRAGPEIDAFLSGELRHHKAKTHQLDSHDPLSVLCGRAWEAAKTMRGAPYDPDAQAEMDAVAAELEAGVALMGPLVVSFQRELAQSRADAEFLLGETQTLHKGIGDRDAVILAKIEEIRERDRSLVERDQQLIGLPELKHARETLRRRFDEAEHELGKTRDHLHLTHLALAHRDGEIIRLNGEVEALHASWLNASERARDIEASTSWRISYGLRRLLAPFPGLRTLLRRTAKLGWWIVTLKLGRKLAERFQQAAPAEVATPSPVEEVAPAPLSVETPVAEDAPPPSAASDARLKVVFLSGEPDTPGHHYRIARHARAAEALGVEAVVVRADEADGALDQFRGADLLFVWRATWDEAKVGPAVEAARAAGAVVVFDIDDLIFEPDLADPEVIDGLRIGRQDLSQMREYFGRLQQSLLAADYVCAPTPELARLMHRRHGRADRPAFQLLNGFDDEVVQRSRLAARAWRRAEHDGLIRIGYATGSRTHQHDFDQAAAAVAQILREHIECRLVLFRNSHEEVLYLAEFPDFDGLTDRIEWRTLVPIKDVPNEIARFDINLAPLEVGNVFCESKSELKYFEAALVDVPTIASPTEPYRLAIRDGETGFLAGSTEEWYAALKRLVTDAKLRKTVARAALFDSIARYGSERRAEAFQSLLDQTLSGGRRGARAFALDLSRNRRGPAPAPQVPAHEVVFEADRLKPSATTVVVTLHDGGGLVEEALASVAAQTLADIDLVVVDDASPGASPETARGWIEANRERFNRVLLVRNTEVSGPALSRNVGFANAETPHVLVLDADDRLLPDCVERLLQAVEASGAAFAYPLSRRIGEDGAQPGEALARRAAWAAVGGHAPGRELAADLAADGWFGLPVPEVLAEHRHSRPAPEALPTAAPQVVPPAETDSRSLKVTFVTGESDAGDERVRLYMRAARDTGATATLVHAADAYADLESFRTADMVIVSRAPWDDLNLGAAIAVAREGGAVVVFDAESLCVEPELAGAEDSAGYDYALRLQQTLIEADYATASTPALAQFVQRYNRLAYNKLSFLLPPGFDEARFGRARLAARARRRAADGLVRIGHLGSLAALAPAAEAVTRVLREHPEARLVVVGRKSKDLIALGALPGFDAPADQIEWRTAAGEDEMARLDISLVPNDVGQTAAETESELKYIEAALADVPTIASPTEPYRLAIRSGDTGFLVASPDGWYGPLKRLVADADLRGRVARAALLDVIVRYGPDRRAEAFQSLLDQALSGGRRGARAFALELARSRQGDTPPLYVPEHEVVFEADRLKASPVTVVIPLYNYAGFVEEALTSVAAQSLADLDLVVVDDASTDASLETARTWIEAHQERFNRVLLLRNLQNSGLAFSRNVGFANAETPFVLPLDADNRLLPDCAERLLAAIETCSAAFAYPLSRLFGDVALSADDQPLGLRPYEPARFVNGNYIDAMALVRRASWAAAGGYDHIRFGWEDYDFWCKLAELGSFGQQVPEVLAEYRVHGASMLRSQTDLEANKRALIQDMETRHPWLRIEEVRQLAAPPARRRPSRV